MTNFSNLKTITEDPNIENPHEFLQELELYVAYAYQKNQRELLIEDAKRSLRSHVLNFLLMVAESHSNVIPSEITYLEKLFNISDIQKYVKTDLTSIMNRRTSIFEAIPTYLREIKTFKNNHDYISLIIECIIKLGINLAATDSTFSNSEAKIIAEYRQLLLRELVGGYYIRDNSLKKVTDAGDKIMISNEGITSSTRSLKEVLYDFDKLIGLEQVKLELNTLINLAQINKIRKQKNLPVVPTSKHLVFSGNPGTGKTTVARLLAEIYGGIGLLSKGHLLEVGRSELIGEYVGQTAMKTREVIKKAIGGILFIDEAYSLAQGGKEDYGKEAIVELLKEMENNRDDLVVIVAGYSKQMQEFIDINPGLKSRFNKYIDFKDYTPNELLEIFKLYLNENGYESTTELNLDILNYFFSIDITKFANARGVRNLFEKMIEQQANRIINYFNISTNDLKLLTKEDFNNAIKLMDDFSKQT